MNLKNIAKSAVFLLFLTFFSLQCHKENTGLLSDEQEEELGRKTDSIIAGSPELFPVFDTAIYHNAYATIDTLIIEILATKFIQRKNVFTYRVKVINSNKIFAFAAPGGYLYVYSGLINQLENGSQFAGIMAHMIAHIDRRHITGNLESRYLFDDLLSVVWRNNHNLTNEIAGYLSSEATSSAFSAQQESEADEYAVKYLTGTDYDSRGILEFYNRMDQLKQAGKNPEILNTHPDYGNRQDHILKVWEDAGSPEGDLYINEYSTLKQLLGI